MLLASLYNAFSKMDQMLKYHRSSCRSGLPFELPPEKWAAPTNHFVVVNGALDKPQSSSSLIYRRTRLQQGRMDNLDILPVGNSDHAAEARVGDQRLVGPCVIHP